VRIILCLAQQIDAFNQGTQVHGRPVTDGTVIDGKDCPAAPRG
jgi:hypothetical protein